MMNIKYRLIELILGTAPEFIAEWSQSAIARIMALEEKTTNKIGKTILRGYCIPLIVVYRLGSAFLYLFYKSFYKPSLSIRTKGGAR